MRCSDASLGFEDRFAIFCDQVGGCACRLPSRGARRCPPELLTPAHSAAVVTWPHMPLLAGPHTHRPSRTGHLQLGDFLEGLVQRAVDVLELFFQLDAAEQAVSRRTVAAVMPVQRTCAALPAIVQCASTASCRPSKKLPPPHHPLHRPRCAASRGAACQRQKHAAGRGRWL